MAFVHLIWAKFVYGCGCFFCFIHHKTPTWSFPESFVKIWLDLAEIFRIEKYVYLFVCLFIDLFVLFILIILGPPQKVTLKILWWSDLIWLKYLGSRNCLFACFFVFFCLLICLFLFQSYWGTNRKLSWKFGEDLGWFGWDI